MNTHPPITDVKLQEAIERVKHAYSDNFIGTDVSLDDLETILTALHSAQAELLQRRKDAKLSGEWIDDWGACRVCGGEIPHGHTPNCDVYKQEMHIHTLQGELLAAQADTKRLERIFDIDGPFRILMMDADGNQHGGPYWSREELDAASQNKSEGE